MTLRVYFGQMPRKPKSLYAENRLRELRIERNLTMEALGARAGQIMRGEDLSISTVQKLEGRIMAFTIDYLIAFAQALGVAPGELIEEGASGARYVRLVGDIAAGRWKEAVERYDKLIPVPDGIGGPNAFALRPVGDSMNKIVGDDGFIVVDPDQRDLLDGRPFAISNGEGETTFKLYRSSPPRLEPCSTNPEHESIVVGRSPFTVIGRVVFAGQFL